MSDARTVITIATVGRKSLVTATCADTGLSVMCGRWASRTRNEIQARKDLEKMRAVLYAVNAMEEPRA